MKIRSLITIAVAVELQMFVSVAGLSATPSQTPAPSSASTRGSVRPVHRVLLIGDAAPDARSLHGLTRLEQILTANNIAVLKDPGEVGQADAVIVAGTVSTRGPAAQLLTTSHVPAPVGAEALTIQKGLTYHGKPAIALEGADGSGLMYAALDVADRVSWATNKEDPFQYVVNVSEKPFLRDRGVVAFTMNRAYFESHLHDEQFWVRYFDMFAQDRINQFVLTFGYENGGYMAPLYPYFFNVDGFPDVKVVGLTAEQQSANLKAFKTLLRIADERGVTVKPGIWDHIYRGGVQKGGMTWTSDGKKPTEGLVWGLNSENIAPYTEAALRKFYSLFPEIHDTQFRMHNESGLLDPEIDGFWHEIFGLYQTDEKNIALELRVKGLDKSVIKDAQGKGLNVHLDTKIWMEQMGLPFHPTHINKENQQDARQGYADLLEYPQTYYMNWSLWNGGTQRLLEWADPDYARRLVLNARLYDGPALTVTEMEATKMLGDGPDVPVRDFLNPRYKYTDYEFERYWAFYRVWGRVAYNPQSSGEVLENEYKRRFGPEVGPHVMKALQLSSQVLPRVVAASYPYRMFPTTVGWAEMQHMGSLPQFAQTEEGSDIAQFMNLRDEATSIIQGTDTAMRRPEETSQWFARTSDSILAEVAAAERRSHAGTTNNELKATLTDARILAAMARYHSWRQLAGVDYNLYKQAGSLPAFDDAIANEKKALQAWRDMVEAAGDVYIDNMTFGPNNRDFPRHWKDELPKMEKEFGELVKEREAAVASNSKPVTIPVRTASPEFPAVALAQPNPSRAIPGTGQVVSAKVLYPENVKWIRLRYRHLNQKEDYLTAEMTPGSQKGSYTARIPATFITPQWDLMYYVEVVDKNGNGRIYPDLEVETPYVVVQVKR